MRGPDVVLVEECVRGAWLSGRVLPDVVAVDTDWIAVFRLFEGRGESSNISSTEMKAVERSMVVGSVQPQIFGVGFDGGYGLLSVANLRVRDTPILVSRAILA
jgi:hypothetical protein